MPNANVNDLLCRRSDLTSELQQQPHSIEVYLQRARVHDALEYPDLAASDAYKALLLTDEVDGGEFEEEVLEWLRLRKKNEMDKSRLAEPSVEVLVEQAHSMAKEAYVILVQALAHCGDLQNACLLSERACGAFPQDVQLKNLNTYVASLLNLDPGGRVGNEGVSAGKAHNLVGSNVRRELYPWNDHEPDRLSDDDLVYLNIELSKCAPKLEIRAVELPALTTTATNGVEIDSSTVRQLGMFAREDLSPGDVILLEPSILTANNRLHEALCDACSAPLPVLSSLDNPIACSDCCDIYFCSDACLDRAQQLYHPAVCGLEDYDVIAKDPSAASATDSLYLLLATRAIAMAETQDAHPLDLSQVKYLWGDFSPTGSVEERKLPFDFNRNIAQPIHILSNMGLNPFSPETLQKYDTWVLNTLFAKFRGVASAKLNVNTLKPDVAAVHPLWCLANHSCAPNVKWNWGAEAGDFKNGEKGAMGFLVRTEAEVVQWGNEERRGGIRKDQEVLNHYCDIAMDVKERRDWAVGALGGICTCERCLHEEQDEQGRLPG